MRIRIYTKTGDKGKTSLFGGKRVAKSDLRVEAYGAVDELSSTIGIAIAQIKNPSGACLPARQGEAGEKLKKELLRIQQDLFEIGGVLSNLSTLGDLGYLKNRVTQLEKSIDSLTEKLPKLQNFILPGGGKAGSLLHFTRCVCRRAERRIVALSEKEKVDESILKYFNRLSDLLFVMARFVNFKEGKKETIWKMSKV